MTNNEKILQAVVQMKELQKENFGKRLTII